MKYQSWEEFIAAADDTVDPVLVLHPDTYEKMSAALIADITESGIEIMPSKHIPYPEWFVVDRSKLVRKLAKEEKS